MQLAMNSSTDRSQSVGISGMLQQSFDSISFTLLRGLVQRRVAKLNKQQPQLT